MASSLIVNQKSVKDLLQSTKEGFLIPDYQRPYAWERVNCETLWNDLFQFAFPDENIDNFDPSEFYFLGPIVTFKNKANQLEVIDGQQRLSTLMLLLRAFYNRIKDMKDNRSLSIKSEIEKCLWKADMFGSYNPEDIKIESDVAMEADREDFVNILRYGKPINSNSLYTKNFTFFEEKIQGFLNKYPGWFANLPGVILNYCILLPIEAESQNTALRIFSTLNDRGKPLSDADIFKAKFYSFFKERGEKDQFIAKWKALEETANTTFHPIYGTPLDELFTRYMYYERARLGIKESTTTSLRKFYISQNPTLLKSAETFDNLITVADFWTDVLRQNSDRFSDRVLRRLFVLEYAPNGMWTYAVTAYFMTNKDKDGNLDDEQFYQFLNKITAFIFAFAITNPGVNSLRTPLYAELIKIVNGEEVTFDKFKFDEQRFRSIFDNYIFGNGRAVTKAYLTWWAFHNDSQQLLLLSNRYDIEHIFSRARQANDYTLTNPANLEKLGNKSLLEQRINIRASDYRFVDKKKYYTGFMSAKGEKPASEIAELVEMAGTHADFAEADIETRDAAILDAFIAFLASQKLLLGE